MYKNITNWIIDFLVTKTHISIQVIKYIISGGTAAITELTLLYVLTEFLGIWYIYSVFIAFLFAFCISFLLQKFWTFQDKNIDKAHKQAIFYLLITITNLAINIVAIYILVEVFGLWYIFAQVLISGFIAISSFFIYKFVIFQKGLKQ